MLLQNYYKDVLLVCASQTCMHRYYSRISMIIGRHLNHTFLYYCDSPGGLAWCLIASTAYINVWNFLAAKTALHILANFQDK